MTIRKCTEADADRVAELCARACADDALLGDKMHPYRKEYPEDFIAYFHRKFLKSIGNDAHQPIVTIETGEEGHEIITGYADWTRRRATDEDKLFANASTDSTLNRAADPAYADIFERADPFTKHYWTGPRAESWYLDLLMVDPSHQRKGLGRELVRHGLQLASQDGVCASLIASEAGDGLYVSCGFEAVGHMSEGEGNPLRGVPGGRILFYEPASR